MTGPLEGVRVVEVGGIGPVPFAGMIFADLGAEVMRIDRPNGIFSPEAHLILLRGRRSIALDLGDERCREIVRSLAQSADIVVEGFRPGVMESLGLGPDEMIASNPRLVYGRMTGWGQDGPLARTAGHDINYIASVGALEPLASDRSRPTPPLNMLGDFGGGAMLLVYGVLAAVLQARLTGKGQVVDAAIVDGAALLTAMLHSMRASGTWSEPRGENLFDGGAPFYGTYETSDGGWLALGAVEPKFYAQLLQGLGLADVLAGVEQYDQRRWPEMRDMIAHMIRNRSRATWESVFEGTDACVTVVRAPHEVLADPHLVGRGTFAVVDEILQPAPAPRFSRTIPAPVRAAAPVGTHTRAVLLEVGLSDDEIEYLAAKGSIRVAPGEHASASRMPDERE